MTDRGLHDSEVDARGTGPGAATERTHQFCGPAVRPRGGFPLMPETRPTARQRQEVVQKQHIA